MGRRRMRRALVRGRQAIFWCIRDDSLVLRHPSGLDEIVVPIPHLDDDVELQGHVSRLREKQWVDPAAVEELVDIAQGLFG